MNDIGQKKDFLTKVFKNNINFARDGVNIAVACPFCSESKSSEKKKLSIHIENEQCHCWVCGFKSKSILPILKKINAPQSYFLKYKKLFKRNVQFSEKEEEKVSLSEFDLIYLFNPGEKSKDPDVKACLNYLKKRGVTKAQLWKYKICTASKGQLKRRIIIPSFDAEGSLNYYTTRCINNESSLKYINANAKKKDFIFNELFIDWSKELCILEGPFDYLNVNVNATCILGSNFAENHLLFKKIISNKTPIVLCLDKDVEKKQASIANKFLEYGISVKTLELENYSDVGQLPQGVFKDLLSKSKEWDKNRSLYYKINSIQSGSLV